MIDFKEIKKGLFRYEEPKGGWVVTIKDAGKLLKAAEKVRDAGIKHFDCFTPFPMHGLEKAMGLPRSWVPLFSLIGGLTGLTFAFSAMTYIESFFWPMIHGGKPLFAWPAYVPIMFEMTILFSAFATLGTFIYLGRLGKTKRTPVLNTVTSSGFAVWIGDTITKKEVEKMLSGLYSNVEETPASTV